MRRSNQVLLGIAALWSLGIIVAAIVLPSYSSTSISSSGAVHSSSATLVQENGVWALVPVGLPSVAVAAATIALYSRGRQLKQSAGVVAWVLTGAVLVVSVLGMLTIGIFILPVGVLLLVVCARSGPATA